MVFDRLRSALTGQPTGPSTLIGNALLPIKAASAPLYERCIWFVHDGSFPEVLLELDAAHQPELPKLMLEAGSISSWHRVQSDDHKLRLKQAGLGDDPATSIPGFRSQLYRGDATQEQYLRLAQLLAVVGTGPNRTVEGVPRWLTALTNDLTVANNKGALKYLDWPPERLADLLRLDGCPDRQVPTLVFLALLEQERVWSSMIKPHEWPGIDNYLLGFGYLIDRVAAGRLSADARVGVAERAQADPRVAHALAPMIAELSGDKAKGVRQAAIGALQVLAPDVRAAVLPAVLEKLPASAVG